MQPHIAMALVHPYTREAIAVATRSFQGREPNWDLDPALQNALWGFTERIAEHAAAGPSVLGWLPLKTGQLSATIFEQLPLIATLIEESYPFIHDNFGVLYGIAGGVSVHFCLSRIALFTTIVVQAQESELDPALFVQG